MQPTVLKAARLACLNYKPELSGSHHSDTAAAVRFPEVLVTCWSVQGC